jgi:hypothetical protein
MAWPTALGASSSLSRAASAAVALALGVAPALAGQRYWRDDLLPYAYYSTIDGLWGALRYTRASPVGFAERPEPHLAALRLEAAASTAGSWRAVADAQAPAWWDGWRAAVTLSAGRDNRLGFYGVGNETPYAPDSVRLAGAYFYRVSRSRAAARATVQRRIAGPLRVLAGVTVARTDFRALPGPSVFRRSLATGAVDSATIPFTDVAVRTGAVLDTRDHELDPHAGVLVEALFASGRGYTRTTVQARVAVHPLERLVLAGRAAAEGMGGAPPLAVQQEMESSDGPFVAVGGYRSLRGYYDGRFTGRGKLLAGLEARYAVVRAPTLMELKLVAFYDAGRVFGPGEATRLTTAGLHHAAGGAVAARFLRNALLVAGYGRGSEGGQLLLGTTWSY